jgi:uncharacterized membrane protein
VLKNIKETCLDYLKNQATQQINKKRNLRKMERRVIKFNLMGAIFVLLLIIAAIVGIIAKVLIIYGLFCLIKLFGVFPQKAIQTLQKSMSLIQLITATIGCMIGFGIYKLEGLKK